MGEFDDRLNSILSSPKDMEKIMELARSISGGTSGGEEKSAEPETADSVPDAKMMGMLTKIMGGLSSAGDGKNAEILRAMRPYLKKERQESLKKAAEIAKMAKLAKIALADMSGGEKDV